MPRSDRSGRRQRPRGKRRGLPRTEKNRAANRRGTPAGDPSAGSLTRDPAALGKTTLTSHITAVYDKIMLLIWAICWLSFPAAAAAQLVCAPSSRLFASEVLGEVPPPLFGLPVHLPAGACHRDPGVRLRLGLTTIGVSAIGCRLGVPIPHRLPGYPEHLGDALLGPLLGVGLA